MHPRSACAIGLGITSLSQRARRRIERALGHSVSWHASSDPGPLLADPGAVTELLVALPVIVDGALLRRLPRLRLIAVLGTSTSNIDCVAADAAGITVRNVQHYCDDETAEFTTALALGGLRGLLFPALPTRSLNETRVGVVGLGQVGGIVARQLDALGINVVPIGRTTPPPHPADRRLPRGESARAAGR